MQNCQISLIRFSMHAQWIHKEPTLNQTTTAASQSTASLYSVSCLEKRQSPMAAVVTANTRTTASRLLDAR